jgi:hypothetical protein
MAIDRKYGRVTLEHGTIAEDEPVVVFRAQDVLLPELLQHYRLLCADAGSPPRHLDAIDKATDAIETWQQTHRVQVPNSESSREWLGG